MPLPKPKKDESHDDFMKRCMSDDVMLKEYDDEKQRYAVCQSQWDDSRSIPKPEKDESYNDFMNRAMSDKVILAEYEDKRKRHNVCQKLWADYHSFDNTETYDPIRALNESTSIERRVLAVDDIELRVTDGDEPKITGYAAKYGKWSLDLGGFTERIRKGAFDEAMEESDVRALKNHDPNLLLGRTSSGTLRLTSNSVGLNFEVDVPDTTTGKDTVVEIRRKDITGCSFSFTTAEDDWKYLEDGSVQRTIIKIGDLFDVGPVTYPAYPDTTVAARSLDAFKESVKNTEDDEKQNEIDDERRRAIERGYRKAERIIIRCKLAEV